jgi:thioredoxin 1
MIKAFTATWCGPCKMIKPILHKLNDEGTIEIEFYDVDDNSDIAKEYGIKAVPTLVFINDGQEIKRTTGFKPAQELVKEHEAMINDSN